MYFFVVETLYNKLLYLPKIFFGEYRGSQAILVGNHHQFVVQLTGYPAQVLKNVGEENELFKFLNLEIICFKYQGAVAVNKQYFFLFHAARR